MREIQVADVLPQGGGLVVELEPVGVVDHLGGEIWEVRTKLGNRIARVLFANEGQTMVLLHSFIKKQQKTPGPDLDLAKDRLKQLKRR